MAAEMTAKEAFLSELIKRNRSWEPCCVSCENFNANTFRCKLAPDHEVPDMTLLHGCPKWVDDIPF